MKKHYQALGLKEDASQAQIQDAYNKLSKELERYEPPESVIQRISLCEKRITDQMVL